MKKLKKNILFLPLIFVLNIAFGQGYWNGYISNHTSINVIGGYHYPDIKKFNEYFQNNYSLDFGKEIKMAGIDFATNTIYSRGPVTDSHSSYLQLMPVTLRFSDSLNFKMGGYSIGFLAYGKDLFYKSKYFDLIYGIGFNTGRYKLLRNDLLLSPETLKYTNPFFAPKFTLEPRLVFGRVMLGIRAEYMYDITYSGWRKKAEVLPDIPELKNKGLGFHATLGLNLEFKDQKCDTSIEETESDTLDYEYDSTYRAESNFRVDFIYGYYLPNFKKLNTQLLSEFSKSINSMLPTVGGELAWGEEEFGMRLSYRKILSTELELSDTLSLEVKGFHLGFGAGADFAMSSKVFDLIVGFGGEVGRLVLLRNSANNGTLKYTNPFFAPKLMLEPRINIGVLTLGLRAEYMYDLTYSGWREETYNAPNFGSAKASGFNVTGIAGLNF